MDFFAFDGDYVARLQSGDRWTMEHFFRYFSDFMLIKLRRLGVRTIEDIDDIRQEVFVRVFHVIRAGELRDATRLGAFVSSVCRNVFLEWCRKKEKTVPLSEDIDPPYDDDLDEYLATKESIARTRRAIDGLPNPHGYVLRALFMEERDKDELCRELGIDRAYLRVVVHRAKEKFRDDYTQMFGSDETPDGGPSLPE